MKRLMITAVLCLTFALTACGNKCEGDDCSKLTLETSTAALNAKENVTNNLTDLGEMLAFLESSDLMGDLFDMVPSETVVVCAPSPAGEKDAEPDCWEEEAEPEEMDTDLSEMASDIATWLEEAIFVDSQLESDGDTLVYLLDPIVFCDMDGEDMEDDTEECKELLTSVPIRVQVASYSENNLDIDVLFGDAKLDPINLMLHEAMLAIEVDLGVTRDVAQLYIDALGEEDMDTELPSTFKGVVGLSLEKVSDDQYRLTYEVDEAIEVGMTIDEDDFLFTLGKSTLTMTADKTAKTLSFDADIGALDVEFPYQAFINAMWDEGEDDWDEDGEMPPDEKPVDPPQDDIMDGEAPAVSGSASVHISGFTGAAALAATDDTFQATGLGLGNLPSTFKRNDDILLSVTVNSGNTFDLEVAAIENELSISVFPQFEIAIMMAFAAIESDLNELPSFMADDTLSATLAADPKPTIKLVDDALMVAAGELSIASTAYPEDSLTVATGQCLTGEEDDDAPLPEGDGQEDPLPEESESVHEILSTLVVGDCQ